METNGDPDLLGLLCWIAHYPLKAAEGGLAVAQPTREGDGNERDSDEEGSKGETHAVGFTRGDGLD